MSAVANALKFTLVEVPDRVTASVYVPMSSPSVQDPAGIVATPFDDTTVPDPAGVPVDPTVAYVTDAPVTRLPKRSVTVTVRSSAGEVATVDVCRLPEETVTLKGSPCVALAVNVTLVVVPATNTPREFVPTVVDNTHEEFGIVATPLAFEVTVPLPDPAGEPVTAYVTVAPDTVLSNWSRTTTT